ncbi:MAG: restriction endonuclease subunit S [Synechococcales bacterium]|nr:restriction endonuclease subunit S [Synechococcales bacterium]
MSELPMGWEISSLAQVVSKLVDGSHSPPSKQADGLPMLSARNISDGRIIFDDYRLIKQADFEIEDRRTNIRPGDVLLTIVGAIGRTVIVPNLFQKFTLQRSVAVIRLHDGIDSEYLKYVFDAPEFQEWMLENAKGTAQKGIYLKKLGSAHIPVAPLNEQRRIVAKLDRLFARSRCAREELGRVSGLVQRYKQAVLAAAFRGDLTADWREKSGKLRTEWRNVSLDNLISCSQNGLSKRYGSDGQEIVVLRLADIKDYKVCLSEPRKIKLTKQEKDKYILQIGDILVVRVNGSKDIVGRLVLITEELNAGYCDHFIRLSLNSECNPEWLSYHGNSERFRKYISENIVSSAGQNTVSQGTLKDYVLEVPCLEEQKEIVQRIEKLFKAIDLIEQEHQQASKLLDRLEQATLSKAFRGELVPQDPNDEPAAVLLERIQSDRQGQPKRKAIKSTRKPRAKSK